MSSLSRRLLVPALLVALGVSAAASQVFRSGTDLVLLSVTASDGKNHLISGLTKGDFQVLEDGIAQDVSLFASDPQPIALSLLIDTSTSMEMKLKIAQEAAIGFCRRLRANDVAQVITFDSDTRVRQAFTHDSAALEAAIRQIRTGGSTSLYTAIYVGLNELSGLRKTQPAEEVRRSAIVVLSDGEDNTSLLKYDDVLDLAKRSNVAVYAIAMRDRTDRSDARGFNEADFVLRSLTQASGGRPFTVDDLSQLPAIYTQIADELASQYTLGYVSSNTKRDGLWRQVSVKVLKPNVAARTKAGYFAPKKG
jgi:Ca-activated chloride channel family protein